MGEMCRPGGGQIVEACQHNWRHGRRKRRGFVINIEMMTKTGLYGLRMKLNQFWYVWKWYVSPYHRFMWLSPVGASLPIKRVTAKKLGEVDVSLAALH